MNFRQRLSARTTRAALFATVVCAGVVMSGARLDEPLRAAPARRIAPAGTLPLTFERAQAGVYTARSRGYDVRISSDAVVIALAAGEALPPARVRWVFVDAAPGVVVPEARVDATPAALKARRRGWLAHLRTFGRVRMNAIHPGIDVVYFGSDRELEYEIQVAAEASPDRIAMAFEGADSVGLDASGDLVVSASGRQLTMRRPDAYQNVNGTRTRVTAEYAVRDRIARVVLGEYDRSRPVTIHPAP